MKKNISVYNYKNVKKISQNKFNYMFNVLSDEERGRIKRFKYKKDRESRIISRFLLRKILSASLKTEASKIKLINDKYDKPVLIYPKIKNFHFNVSHSGEYIVMTVNKKGRVGIDIEKIKSIDLSVSESCFTKNEINYLYSKKGEENKRFYKLWTLKESFVKAIGEGLSYPLKNFYFKFEKKLILHMVKEKISRWKFKMYDIDKKYKMALCVENAEFPDKVIDIENCISL